MHDPAQLADSRIQLHYAIQFMAATNRALGTPRPDSSQVTIDWSDALNGFVGQPLPGDKSCYLALDPANLNSMILDDQQRVVASLSLIGRTMDIALDWHQTELTQLGVTTDNIEFLRYPDDFPDHPLAHGAAFELGDAAARKLLATYFATTRPLLQALVTAHPEASPIYIWPHHFDMATLMTLAGEGESAQTVGVGFSPGDGGYNQPYWYVTPWPYPAKEVLPALSVGDWHTEGWIGAILLADAIGDPTSQDAQRQIQICFDEAVKACRTLLSERFQG